MRLGILLSALFHVAVILAGLVVLPAKWNEQEEFQMIPVELLTVAELTNVIAKAEEAVADELEVPEPEERRVAEAAPPPPEPEIKEISKDAIPPLPEDKPDEKKPEPKVEEKPKVVKETALAKARPRRKPTPPAPEKKKDDFNLDEIAALLDKTPQEKKKPKVDKTEDSLDDFLASLQDTNQQSVGAGNDMTMSELAYLKSAIEKCWRPPAGAANPEELIVELKIFLNRDGTLASQPEVIRSGTSSFSSNTFTKAAENAAMRAVDKCAPYDLLPDDKYDRWRMVTMTFDPAKMIGR